MFVETNIAFILVNEEYKIINTKPFQKNYRPISVRSIICLKGNSINDLTIK